MSRFRSETNLKTADWMVAETMTGTAILRKSWVQTCTEKTLQVEVPRW